MTATMNVLGNSIAILSAAAVILENRCCRFFFLKGVLLAFPQSRSDNFAWARP